MKKLIKKIVENDRLLLLILVVISLGSVYYLLLPGFYEPQDLHHIADIYEMYRAMISGQLPPRWGPDFIYNFGYPLFNFYYVGPFYLGALFYFLSGSLRFSYELIFIVSVVISACGFYLFMRNRFSVLASFAAAVLFTYTPYKAVQIYVRGSMGELLAISLMPWLLYFIDKYINENKRKWYILSILISVFIMLSHNYFWVLIFAFSGFYILIVSVSKKQIGILWKYFIQIIVTLGITAYWWLPALSEQKLLNTQTPFPLIDHFPFIKQLLKPFWGYGASLWGPYDGMSFQLGIVNITAVIYSLTVFLVVKKKKNNQLFLWSLISFILCIFFMNVRSFFLWRIVPFYNLFQFPWRLLAFTAFFSSVLAACVVDNLLENKKNLPGKAVSGLFIILSIALTFGYFRPSQIFYKNDNDYLNRMFANRSSYGYKSTVSPDYINWSEDYLLLPKWMNKKPGFLPDEKFVSSDTGKLTVKNIREINPVSWEATVAVNTPGELYFYSMYFPGWKASVNGKGADITPGKDGQIVINLAGGDNLVKVYWTETDLRKIADAISLFFILVLIGIGFRKNEDNKNRTAEN